MDSQQIVLILGAGALISTGALIAGLVTGYWRGKRRAKQQALAIGSEIEQLAGIGRAILGAQLRLDALCEVIYQQATRMVDTRNFQLGLFEGNDYITKVWVRDGVRLPVSRFQGSADVGIVGWVRTSAQSLRINDYTKEWETLPARPTYESNNPPRSALFTPLVVGGDVIGLIAVQSDQPNSFSEESQRLLTVLASQAGGAVRNAQLFQQTRDRAEQLRVISEVGRQISAMQPLASLFRQIVTIIDEAFHFYAVTIFLHDPTTEEIRLRASSHDEFESRNLVLRAGQGLIGHAFMTGATINSPDVTQNEHYIHLTVLPRTHSELSIPLKVETRVLGVLDVQSDLPDAFDEERIASLESLAGQIAVAIQEAQAYENAQRQTERVNAMAEASRAVVSILDINDLLDAVVDLVADYFGYDRVHLFLRSGQRVVFRSGSGVHSAKWAIERLSYDINDGGFIPWVARTGQPLLSGNVQSDERYIVGSGLEDTHSEMTVPIAMGQRILGVFDIQNPQPDAFSAEDLKLVQALSDTIAVGLRNAGLFATETRRRVLAETLRDVSTVLTSSLELESVLDGILLGLERVVHYEAAMIVLFHDDNGLGLVSAVRGVINEDHVLGEIVPLGDDMLPKIWDLLHQMEMPEGDASSLQHDHLYAPLQVGGQDIGILAVDHIGPDRFSPEDVEIINTFASQAAVAIANAQLYSAQREEAWISTALLQVAEATSRSTSLDDVLSTIAEITPLLSGVEWCVVFLTEDRTFRVVEAEGINDELKDKVKGHIFHTDDWEPFAKLYEEDKPVVMVGASLTSPQGFDMDISQVAQAILLPLYAKGEVMGAMLIAQRNGGESLTTRKIELVSGIANQAALAIEGAQLFAAQQEEAWVTTALLSVAESINSTLGMEQTLEALVRLTSMLVGVQRCGILQWDPALQYFYGAASYGMSTEHEEAFTNFVLTNQETEFFQRLRDNTEPLAAGQGTEHPLPEPWLILFEIDALLFLPLLAKGTLTGYMIVENLLDNSRLNQRRVNILIGIAHQSALVLENSRLQEASNERQRLERELEVASGIQHSFLPQQLPNLAGWEIAAYYRAARQVGGDFYDFIPLNSGKWGIVIADVADKGVPAALFMALSRTNIRAAAYTRDDPCATLMRVNELLLSDIRSDLFVTVWYGVWDPLSGHISYACSGHNPPMLIRADGQIQELSAKGLALGVIETIKMEEKKVTLEPGDVLVAYTDGITDLLRNDGVEFGVQGLQTTATNSRHLPVFEMRRHIVQALDAFRGDEPQFDDITMILLKRDMQSQ